MFVEQPLASPGNVNDCVAFSECVSSCYCLIIVIMLYDASATYFHFVDEWCNEWLSNKKDLNANSNKLITKGDTTWHWHYVRVAGKASIKGLFKSLQGHCFKSSYKSRGCTVPSPFFWHNNRFRALIHISLLDKPWVGGWPVITLDPYFTSPKVTPTGRLGQLWKHQVVTQVLFDQNSHCCSQEINWKFFLCQQNIHSTKWLNLSRDTVSFN